MLAKYRQKNWDEAERYLLAKAQAPELENTINTFKKG